MFCFTMIDIGLNLFKWNGGQIEWMVVFFLLQHGRQRQGYRAMNNSLTAGTYHNMNTQLLNDGSFSHDFDNHPLASLAVELGIKHLLPGPQIKLCLAHRKNDLMMNEDGFQVGVPVGFARPVVPVV